MPGRNDKDGRHFQGRGSSPMDEDCRLLEQTLPRSPERPSGVPGTPQLVQRELLAGARQKEAVVEGGASNRPASLRRRAQVLLTSEMSAGF